MRGELMNCLPDELLADILDKVWEERHALVCKKWDTVGKKLGHLEINLNHLHEQDSHANSGLVLKLMKRDVRKLIIHGYHDCLHANYTWLSDLGGTLEELTIEAPVNHIGRPFDLELLSKTCSKLTYISLYQVQAICQGDYQDVKVGFPAPNVQVGFRALKYCHIDRVNINLAELLKGCPVLEKLSAVMSARKDAQMYMLSSSTLKWLSLQVKDWPPDNFVLEFPNLETARICKCGNLELNAPCLKRLSLSHCECLTLNVSDPLETLVFVLDSVMSLKTIALVDKMHFKSVTLSHRWNAFKCYTEASAHDVVEMILDSKQFRECEVLQVKGFNVNVNNECKKKLSSGISLDRLRTFVLKMPKDFPGDFPEEMPKDFAADMDKLGDLVNSFVKHCPALQYIFLLKELSDDPEKLESLAKVITSIPVKIL